MGKHYKSLPQSRTFFGANSLMFSVSPMVLNCSDFIYFYKFQFVSRKLLILSRF